MFEFDEDDAKFNEDYIFCVYCGNKDSEDMWENNDSNVYTCPSCNKEMELCVDIEVSYSTYKRES